MGSLYKLQSPSGKCYIGITSKTLAKRWEQHRFNAAKGHGTRQGSDCAGLYNAIRKYGPQAFSIGSIAESDDWATLQQLEKDAILVHGSLFPGGYNLSEGGEGALGHRPTDEARRRMSAAHKRAPVALVEIRAKGLAKAVAVRAANWNAKSDEEKAVWLVGHRQRLREARARPKVREADFLRLRAQGADPEYRKRLSAALIGRSMPEWSNERKLALSAKRRAEWADPVMREKRLAGFARAKIEREHGKT